MRTLSKMRSPTVIGFLWLLVAGCGSGGSPVNPPPAAPVTALSRNPSYHGGRLLQQVRVVTLFWGTELAQTDLHRHFNGFFQSLFADGRYMAHLAQYSAGGYQIGNGSFAATTNDGVPPPARVTDAQIQAEIGAQIGLGKLQEPAVDTLYVVLLPPKVVVVDPNGIDSQQGFTGYHYYSQAGGFPYAVVRAESQDEMTLTASHELAEAVTDPQCETWATVAWIDEQYGEIGDIVQNMYAAGQIGKASYEDVLVGGDGTRYLVQKVWSIRDRAPIGL